RQLRRARDELETKVAERTAELRRSEAYLAEAQRLSHTGSWAFIPATGKHGYWSEEILRLTGFDPAGGPPRFEEFEQRIHPDDRARTKEHFRIKAPELEPAHDDTAIVRWTTTNPRGDDEHFGIVHYGTDREDLSQVAKSPIRLNRGHAETIFRVRMLGLKPQTTYYYKVTSIGSGGASDGGGGLDNHSPPPAPAERIINSRADSSLPPAYR